MAVHLFETLAPFRFVEDRGITPIEKITVLLPVFVRFINGHWTFAEAGYVRRAAMSGKRRVTIALRGD